MRRQVPSLQISGSRLDVGLGTLLRLSRVWTHRALPASALLGFCESNGEAVLVWVRVSGEVSAHRACCT